MPGRTRQRRLLAGRSPIRLCITGYCTLPFERLTARLACSAFILLAGLPSLTRTAEAPTCADKPGVGALTPYPGVYNFYYENDLVNGTDNNYTSGLKLSWVSANLKSYVEDPCLPLWVRKLNSLSTILQPGYFAARNMVVTGGQSMYTPTDPTRTDLIQDDRPYAGWLYLGLAWNARDERHMNTVELDIGMVGPASQVQQMQNFVHDLRGLDRFEGWHNQLRNELGVQVVSERKTRVFDYAAKSWPRIDLITHYGASIGNVKTHLNAGAEVRLGAWLPNDFGTSSIRPASDSNAPLMESASRRLSSRGAHVFAAFDARIVARDIFLDGNTFVDSHSVNKHYIVGDLALGVAWQWQGGKITYSHIVRSKQFQDQPESHSFSSITFSIEY